MAPVEAGLTFLVAGVSCKTFSLLNTKRDTALTQLGESQVTFESFIAIAKRDRPKIVILENVGGAPWPRLSAVVENHQTYGEEDVVKMMKRHWHEDDPAYATCIINADAKNYYLPHTRARGYLIGFSRHHFKNARDLADGWVETVKDLARQASSPVSDFIFQSDELRLFEFRAKLFKTLADGTDKGKGGGRSSWASTFSAGIIYRQLEELGNGHPFTRTDKGTQMMPPDHVWVEYLTKRTEREVDFLDTSCLRAALHGHDNFQGKE